MTIAGVGLRVESNSAAVTAAFVARYSAAAAPVADGFQCELSVHVAPGNAAPDAPAQWQFPDDDHATVEGPGWSATLDLAAGRADVNAEVSPEQRPLALRAIVEGIPLSLISRKDRHPVHAASVRQGSAALLLHGTSGVGKSTLAYAAHRADIEVLADDATRVQLTPELRAWGDGREPFLHLLASARDEFAELRGLQPDWLSAGGISKLSIRVRQKGLASLPPYATAVRVCLLTRDNGPVARREASPSEIRDALVNAPEAVADRSPGQRTRVAAALAQPGGWHLKLSRDPADAIPHLREMLALMSGKAGSRSD